MCVISIEKIFRTTGDKITKQEGKKKVHGTLGHQSILKAERGRQEAKAAWIPGSGHYQKPRSKIILRMREREIKSVNCSESSIKQELNFNKLTAVSVRQHRSLFFIHKEIICTLAEGRNREGLLHAVICIPGSL